MGCLGAIRSIQLPKPLRNASSTVSGFFKSCFSRSIFSKYFYSSLPSTVFFTYHSPSASNENVETELTSIVVSNEYNSPSMPNLTSPYTTTTPSITANLDHFQFKRIICVVRANRDYPPPRDSGFEESDISTKTTSSSPPSTSALASATLTDLPPTPANMQNVLSFREGQRIAVCETLKGWYIGFVLSENDSIDELLEYSSPSSTYVFSQRQFGIFPLETVTIDKDWLLKKWTSLPSSTANSSSSTLYTDATSRSPSPPIERKSTPGVTIEPVLFSENELPKNKMTETFSDIDISSMTIVGL